MAEAYTNVRLILDKLLRHPLLKDLPLETAVDYTVDFMRIVGAFDMFEHKKETLKVHNYKALLPCDYTNMIQVRDAATNKTFRYTTDSFHMFHSEDGMKELTYLIQGSIIYTTMREGNIEISYEAIKVDSEGYPMLPDNSSFTRALELYIKKQWFTILFDLGKIQPAVYQNVQQEYAWAVGDCQSEFNRMSIDKMESFTNSFNTLIPRTTEHNNGFDTNGSKEYIKNH